MPPRSSETCDTLIIGGGSAGCVLANRLSADTNRRVLLVEAGGPANDPRIHSSVRWPELLGSEFDWIYSTVPQPHLDNRRLPYPRGKVLGGSSAINAMGHHRGHPSVFDRWQAMGNPGWNFAALLPYFKKSETFSGGADDYRGADGPIFVSRPEEGEQSPVAASFLAAARDTGFNFVEDFNGAGMRGCAWNQLAIRDGVRQSTVACYLSPVLDRPNLTLWTHAAVHGLEIEGGRCTGARVQKGPDAIAVSAGETLLCAGSIDSPRLLMLSGIGKAPDLSALGISVKSDVPGVGRNLHDHMLAGLVYRPRREMPLSKFNHADATLYFDSDGSGVPDLLIMCVTHKKFSTAETGAVPENAFSLVPALMSPRSRGSVTLVTSDPRAPASVDPQAFSDSRDMHAYMYGVEVARALGNSGALGEWRAAELLPRPEPDGRVDLEKFARAATTAFFHPVGTCRMGDDADAVVDSQLRVKGVQGLRVVDASVMPVIPNALPHAAILALAEKAAAEMVQ